LGIAAVNPLKPGRIEVGFEERRLTSIQGVQITNPPQQSAVEGILQQVPFETDVVIPLRPLSNLPTHEEELLTGMAEHVAIEEP
jgi:hypothetical protein